MSGTWGSVNIRSYDDAQKYYEEHPKKHWPRVTLYYATELGVDNSDPQRADRVFHLYHHGVEVIRWYADGNIIINNHGYKTKTTRDRLNSHMPLEYHIQQRKFEWYLRGPNGEFPYENGYLGKDHVQ